MDSKENNVFYAINIVPKQSSGKFTNALPKICRDTDLKVFMRVQSPVDVEMHSLLLLQRLKFTDEQQ